MNNYFENATTVQEKREVLKGLSKPLQQLVKADAIASVNEGLKALYSEDGHRELKTLKQWNSEGKRIKKGEKALCLWSKPTQREKKQEEKSHNDTTQDETMAFFPLCYVFSNLQVQ